MLISRDIEKRWLLGICRDFSFGGESYI